MKKAKQDMLMMTALMLISVLFYFWLIPAQVRVIANNKTSFNSQTFPRLLFIALFLVSLAGFIRALMEYLKLRSEETAETIDGKQHEWSFGYVWKVLTPYVAFAIFLVYTNAFKPLGYIVSTLIFVPCFLLFLGCRKWTYYLFSLLFCAIMYLIFVYILRVPLP